MNMVTELTDETFEQTLSEEPDKLMVIDFWATWCGQCSAMTSVFENVSNEMENVRFCKVNCDECEDICDKAEIRSLPTFVFYKNGAVVNRMYGVMPKSKLIEEISKWI